MLKKYVVASFVLAIGCVWSCQKIIPGGQAVSGDSPQSEVKTAEAGEERPLPDFPCLNANMLMRFVKTGTVECRHSATIDFIDPATSKPLMGILYKMVIDVYFSVPIKEFIKNLQEQSRVVTLNAQTLFVNIHLVDDLKSEKPIKAMVKVKPTIKYTFNGVCSIKVEDLSLQITEIKAPDFGNVVERVPGIVNNMVLTYKSLAIKGIQDQIDTMTQSKFCWYYNFVFEGQTYLRAPMASEPSPAEKAEAQQIVAGTLKKPEAEKSEVEEFNAKKWEEMNNNWECKWSGGC